LEAAVSELAPHDDPTSLGFLLVQAGLISQSQLDFAVEVQEQERANRETPRRLGQVCVELGYITAEALATFLGSQKFRRGDTPAERMSGLLDAVVAAASSAAATVAAATDLQSLATELAEKVR
jgi:hypothetical protein